jgi:hypothetical protein
VPTHDFDAALGHVEHVGEQLAHGLVGTSIDGWCGDANAKRHAVDDFDVSLARSRLYRDVDSCALFHDDAGSLGLAGGL